MSQVVASLPRSESKGRFMARLGLNPRDPRHRHIYNMMKDEASIGREGLALSLRNQREAQRTAEIASPAGSQLFSTSSIPEGLMNRAIFQIYQRAQPTTRIIYNLAFDPDHPEEPNWIIRWMLWHVIRYRDGRQNEDRRARRPSVPDGTNADDSDQEDGQTEDGLTDARHKTLGHKVAESSQTIAERRYDPVRDTWNSYTET